MTPEQEGVRIFDITDLKGRGFQGFKAMKELEDNVGDIPRKPGVYVAVTANDTAPRFLMRNPAGRYKGDPTVPIERLKAKWVPGTQTLYIGKATSLRERIKQLLQFSQGQPVRHWGGRFLWQVQCSCAFQIAWLIRKNPVRAERQMLDEFERHFGRLPFADLRRGRRDA